MLLPRPARTPDEETPDVNPGCRNSVPDPRRLQYEVGVAADGDRTSVPSSVDPLRVRPLWSPVLSESSTGAGDLLKCPERAGLSVPE